MGVCSDKACQPTGVRGPRPSDVRHGRAEADGGRAGGNSTESPLGVMACVVSEYLLFGVTCCSLRVIVQPRVFYFFVAHQRQLVIRVFCFVVFDALLAFKSGGRQCHELEAIAWVSAAR